MNNVFVYIEIEDREIADVSLELLTKGRELANTLGVKLEAVVIGKDVEALAPELAKYGADTVWVADDAIFAPFRTLPHTAVMVGLIEKEKLEQLYMNTPSCGAALSNMAIAPDGTVIPCQSWLDASSGLGNILRDDFSDIWKHELCLKLRGMSDEEAIECPFRKVRG